MESLANKEFHQYIKKLIKADHFKIQSPSLRKILLKMVIQKKRQKISLESNVVELSKLIRKDRRTGKIKKSVASSRVLGMLGKLSSDRHLYVPRKINTVGELYTFSEDEISYKFRNYKSKTWLKLNEILETYDLPAINLPSEYAFDPLNP